VLLIVVEQLKMECTPVNGKTIQERAMVENGDATHNTGRPILRYDLQFLQTSFFRHFSGPLIISTH
jgi:hypothetical protein